MLAGGRSRRFGPQDKAVADLAGRPLVGHAVDTVQAVADGAVLSCRGDQLPELRTVLSGVDQSPAAVPDPSPDAGPAAGVAAGLAPCRASEAVVLACDTPLVDPDFLSLLLERADGRDGAVPVIEGSLRPTVAAYRTTAIRAACERSVRSGDGSLRGAVASLDVDCVPEADVPEPWRCLDVNTPADIERARDLHRERSVEEPSG